MKHLQIVLFLIFSCCFLGVKAQQNHFIYIQTENKQPFYIKLDSKLYSSTSTGYIVLSKLKAGEYNLAIGFPRSEWPEQKMQCIIGNKDLGFILKNFGDKGWGLFNLQTMEIVMADEKKKTNVVAVETKSDEFSNMLSNVVNDPTIKQVERMAEPERAPDTTREATAEAVTITQAPEPSTPVAVTVVSSEAPPKSAIRRTLLHKGDAGTEMVYLENNEGGTDTITVFIPLEKNAEAEGNAIVKDETALPAVTPVVSANVPVREEAAQSKKEVKENSPTIEYNPNKEEKGKKAKKESKTADKKFLDLTVEEASKPAPTKAEENRSERKALPSTATAEEKQPEIIVQNSPMINSDCKSLASESDFMKLRKKMVSEDNEEDMINVAKKSFRGKCYTVEQVKNLSVLFLKDEGKYAFFDMAYPHVSDSHNFSNLQGQLTDPYYISRFQVMIRR
jgi:hypothetical protein